MEIYVAVLAFIGFLFICSLIGSAGSWIENERMRKDPTYIPNSKSIFPARKKH